jgi:Peptidase inhibitor family I36
MRTDRSSRRARRRWAWRSVAATLAATGAILAMSAGSASAAKQDCDTIYGEGTICFWHNVGYTGTLWASNTRMGIQLNQWQSAGAAMNNIASLWNHRNVYVSWVATTQNYQAYGGYQACLPTEWAASDLFYEEYPGGPSALWRIRGYYMSGTRTSCPSGTTFVRNS